MEVVLDKGDGERMRHALLVMGFALLPVMARYLLGLPSSAVGSMVKESPSHPYEHPVLSRLLLLHLHDPRTSARLLSGDSTPIHAILCLRNVFAWCAVACAWRGLGSQDCASPARDVGENAAVDVGGTWWAWRIRPARCTQRAYFTRAWTASETYCSLRAPKANARGPAEGAAGEASLIGGRGVAGAAARRWRRDVRGNRHVETDGGDGAVDGRQR
jgi:hypothetical protein